MRCFLHKEFVSEGNEADECIDFRRCNGVAGKVSNQVCEHEGGGGGASVQKQLFIAQIFQRCLLSDFGCIEGLVFPELEVKEGSEVVLIELCQEGFGVFLGDGCQF